MRPSLGLLLLLLASGSAGCRREAPLGTISLELVATLGDTVGPGLLPSEPRAIARDSRGRFFLTLPYRGEEPPFVFAADGKFLQRVGEVGEGPGEFRRPALVFVGRGDSVYFIDRSLGRLSIYTPELAFVGSMSFPTFGDAVRAPDGTFIIATDGDGPSRFTLRRVSATMESGARFALITSPCPPLTCGSTDPRTLSMTTDGRLWTVWRFFRYQVDGWAPTGAELASFSLHPAWYTPYDKLRDPSPEAPPDPILTAIGQDSLGNLWILGRTAQPDWKAALGGPVVTSEGQRLHAVKGRLYDGIVEVLDSQSGARLAHHRFSGNPRFWLPGGLIAASRSTDEGAILIDIFRVSYATPPG